RRDQFRQDLLVDRCVELQRLEERLADLDALLAAAVSRGRTRPSARCECGAAASDRRLVSTPEPRDYCPRCGVAYEPLQEYCLECGERLPVNRGVVGVLASAWQRRFSRYPGDWIWPVLLFFVITVVATGAVLAANGSRSGTRAVPSVMPSTVPLGPGRSPGTVPRISTATVPNAPSVTITTGPIPTAPGSGKPGTTRTPPARNPNALAVWPAAKSG